MADPKHWTSDLPHDACREAREWALTQPDYETAWATCRRGDWMLWLAGRLAGPPGDDSRRQLVLAACECAELSLPLICDENARAVAEATIQTAQAWAHGEATFKDVQEVRWECCRFSWYSGATAAVHAAAAASFFRFNATAIYAAAHSHTLAQCADIVRRHYPTPPKLRG